MKQLNVLYVLTKLELGGAQKVCLALHKGLLAHDHNSHLVSGAEGVLVAEAAQTPGAVFLRSLKREISFMALWQEMITLYDLIKVMRRYKKKYPDLIVHTHSTKAGILGRWAAFFAGVKNRVHTVHGFGFHDYQPFPLWFLFVALEWITMLITTKVICVSLKDQERGSALLPGFAKKSIIIRAAVSDSYFVVPVKRAMQPAAVTIGTISCFKPQKNLFDLLEAFAAVHKLYPHTRLEMIGDGLQRPLIEAWITENNLRAAVTLHGWQADVQPFLEHWDIFALSSLWEGLPCSVVEARLRGLAVVAYDVGGISEIVAQGRGGYVVPAGDKRALADRLQALVERPELLSQVQLYTQDLSSFSVRSMITQHEVLYLSLKSACRSI